jgi:hypothetical protein
MPSTGKPFSEDMKKGWETYFQASTPEPNSTKP